MTKLLIASSEDPDMRYSAGIVVSTPFILVDTGKKKHLLLSSLEYGYAKRALGQKERYELVLMNPLYKEIKGALKLKKGEKARRGSLLARIAALYLKKQGIKDVLVSPRMWVAHAAQLKESGIKPKISEQPFYPGRALKSKMEIEEIVRVRNATVKAMRRCFSIIEQSKIRSTPYSPQRRRGELIFEGTPLTSEFLKSEARKILLEHSCEAQELIISHGAQTAFPHDTGRGVIKAGEPVILDFFPRSMESGYWFDMTRTVCKGEPSPELKRLYATVKQAQDAALKKVRAGVTTGAVHKAASELFEKAGYETDDEEGYIHSTGHGVGLEIHEAPSIHAKGVERLKKGMVVTVEPGLYYKGIGGVRLENTVLVTREGYKDLTRMSRSLVLDGALK